MKKSPKKSLSSGNGQAGNSHSMASRVNSPDIRARIAAADIVRADDPALGGGTVFFGREMVEEVIRSGIPRSANILRVALDFASDAPERLDVLIRELKGYSCFRPADIFPKIDIDAGSFSSAPELLEPVRLAVSEVRDQHRTLLPLTQRQFYYYVRAGGFMAAHKALREGAKLARQAGATDAHQGYWVCLMTLGALLYQRLPSDLIQPTRCLDLLHRFGHQDRKLTVACRSLQARETPKGTAYFSRRMPRMRFHGVEGDWVVAFFSGSPSRHALERICERTVYDWRTYGGHGDAFAFLDNCVYFQDCTEERGEPSFLVWNSCVPHHASWHYVEQVLGERVTLQGDYYEDVANAMKSRRFYYRVGYCPVEFHGELAVATTLLVPGMEGRRGMPLAEAALSSNDPSSEPAYIDHFWTGAANFRRNVAKHDIVSQIFIEESTPFAYPPCRVVHLEHYAKEDESECVMVFLEAFEGKEPIALDTVIWQLKSQRKCPDAMVLRSIKTAKRITDQRLKEQFLNLWV
jgi:hypothetical protein